MAVDRSYILSLSKEELQRELEYALEVKYGLLNALRDAPVMPSPFILMHLGSSAAKHPEDNDRGKQLQRELGLSLIPPKSECEWGAGLWDRIRNKGLVK